MKRTRYKWVNTPSSNLTRVKYFEERPGSASYLLVEFKTGAQYKYEGVTLEDYQAMIAAKSAGKYLNDTIKPKYPATKVAGATI